MNRPKLSRDERLVGELTRLCLSDIDFRLALSAATFLLEENWDEPNFRNEPSRRRKCFETAMVVSYARPFSTARGKAAPFRWKLMPRGFKLSENEERLHEKILANRDGIFAHSDDAVVDVMPALWRSNKPTGELFDIVIVEGGERLRFTRAEIEELHNFLWRVRDQISKAIQEHPAPREDLPVRDMTIEFDKYPKPA